ncbi:MAG: hypothetical protein EXS55_01460 [Candidatus Magasanikbacteria bacterium]|nr:hypothetical protein [Candidatus Magasanikbacteria bacterium]
MLQWIKHLTTGQKTIARLSAFIFIALGLVFLFSGPTALAQSVADPGSELNQGLNVIQQPLGLASTDIRVIIARIIRIALGLLGIVLLVIILYGGFLWMTAGGNEEQIGQAKKVMTNGVIGLAIILSAYSIVLFIMRMLGLGGGPLGGPGVSVPPAQNFSGSGALGSIVKDHYPGRDQTDVPRNTKIVITFRKPVLPNSFIKNTNNSKDGQGKEIFGDCTPQGQNLDWEKDCDAVDLKIISVVRDDTSEPIRGAAILAAYENSKVFTVVIRPYDVLGSASADIGYRVRLTKDIKLDDSANGNPSAFQSGAVGNNYYEWKFLCGTGLDVTPPRVASVFPGAGTVEAKNSVIQIDFTEAIDPIGLQGSFNIGNQNIGKNSFFLDGQAIFLQSGASQKPGGVFRLTNGYRTLEFTPDTPCGVNACGGQVFCLPVCDAIGSNCKEDNYELLLKAARTLSTSSFEAAPFTGAADLAGNALDSKPFGLPSNVATTTVPVFHKWEEPDNYFWNFKLKNEIDLTTPILNRIVPGLDSQFIPAKSLWQMTFNKRMRVEPMYQIGIEEHPLSGNGVPLCRVPRIWFNLDGTTQTRMDHCAFLDDRRQYYLPVVPSEVEDTHFNCFYPGAGPGDDQGPGTGSGWSLQGGKHLFESDLCDDAHPQNCCKTTTTTPNKALCCNGIVDDVKAAKSKDCIDLIKKDSII